MLCVFAVYIVLTDEGKAQKAVIAIDDKRILLMFHNRDEQALRTTAEQYGGLCQSVAKNILKNEQDAEECLNDALLKTWNTIPPAQPASLCAYLLKIVQNLAIDRFRAKTREKRGGTQSAAALDELAEFLPSSENVQSEVERRELLDAVTRFLEGLPAQQRGMFIRRYWGCAPYAEIADAYHMRKHTVEVSLSRIRQNLREHLRKEGLL